MRGRSYWRQHSAFQWWRIAPGPETLHRLEHSSKDNSTTKVTKVTKKKSGIDLALRAKRNRACLALSFVAFVAFVVQIFLRSQPTPELGIIHQIALIVGATGFQVIANSLTDRP
jgi:hypothetical protein